eukprot:scaffold12345_cov48-Attheya_sp.AAC.4
MPVAMGCSPSWLLVGLPVETTSFVLTICANKATVPVDTSQGLAQPSLTSFLLIHPSSVFKSIFHLDDSSAVFETYSVMRTVLRYFRPPIYVSSIQQHFPFVPLSLGMCRRRAGWDLHQ